MLTYDFCVRLMTLSIPIIPCFVVFEKSNTNTVIEQRLIGALLGDGWLEKK